jgi:exopolysaccharide production protein ExoZ
LRRFAKLQMLAWFLTLTSGFFVADQQLAAWQVVPHSFLLNTALTRMAVENLSLLRYGTFFAMGIWLWLIGIRSSPVRLLGLTLCFGGGIIETGISAHEKLRDPTIAGLIGMNCVFLVPVIWALGTAAIARAMLASRRGLVPLRLMRFSRRLGLMTYPLYLLHNEVGGRFFVLLTTRLGVPLGLGLALAAALAILLSWLVCVYLEPRIQRFLRSALQHIEIVVLKPHGCLASLFISGGRVPQS